MRADSTSVWPRLVTELCEGKRGSSPWEGRLGPTREESRARPGSGELEEVGSAGLHSKPGEAVLWTCCPSSQSSCLLKKRQNQETSEP